MKKRERIGVAIGAVAALCLLLPLAFKNRTQKELALTRRELRKHHFKVDDAEFNFSIAPEEKQRAQLLVPAFGWESAVGAQRTPNLGNFSGLYFPTGRQTARVAWKLDIPPGLSGANEFWPFLREQLQSIKPQLNSAAQAASSGSIRFEPKHSDTQTLLPHLAELKRLETIFGLATMSALHDGEPGLAWTNLLAATCLVTSYAPEPIEISHLVRGACLQVAFNTTWHALQSPSWRETQLAELQERWEALDLWSGLGETAAYSRVSIANGFRRERERPMELGFSANDFLRSPAMAWSRLRYSWQRLQYRHEESYKDEKAALLFYRDRETEVRRALRCPTWSEMEQMPGITNALFFRPAYAGGFGTGTRTGVRTMGLNYMGRGKGFLSRVAEAEARRRLLITALALERYRLRSGHYPQSLSDLPSLKSEFITDFMDGNALRYRITDEGHFLLYSVGLDCVDNGGEMPRPRAPMPPLYSSTQEAGMNQGLDLVWPLPEAVP
jgi:hypothetical protein